MIATIGSVVELLSEAGDSTLFVGGGSAGFKSGVIHISDSNLTISVGDGQAAMRIDESDTLSTVEFRGSETNVLVQAGGIAEGTADVYVGRGDGANAQLSVSHGASLVISAIRNDTRRHRLNSTVPPTTFDS